jgi:apolipoprotein N-acyltransferase
LKRRSRLGRWLQVPLLDVGLAMLLGGLQSLAYARTTFWALPLLTLLLLVWRLNGVGAARAALLGWSYGTAALLVGTWWLYISLHRYGGLPAPLAVLAVLALSGMQSLYLAAACAAYARWRRQGPGDALLFAALWLLAELARGLVFTGFPWLASGYAQLDGPLAVLAPWVGVYGIGAMAALLVASAARVPDRPRSALVGVLLPLAVLLALHAAPQDHTRPVGAFSVALLQTNVRQDEKFAAERMPEVLAWTARELLVARADLVLAPETAVPLLPDQLAEFAPGYWEQLRDHFRQSGNRALIGVPLGDFEHGYTNSVAGLSEAPAAYRYDKHHLVPFGEFIPQGFHWFTEMMNIPLGDFNRGARNPPSFALKGQRVAPNICYEDLFGEELARRFVEPALAPTVFANVSNIAWFGPSDIDAQHLAISRMRSLEFQIPMVRATNTGATAVIDHRGEVQARLAPYTRGVLQAVVQGREGRTPYAVWTSALGLWPAGLLAGALVLLFAWQRPAAALQRDGRRTT